MGLFDFFKKTASSQTHETSLHTKTFIMAKMINALKGLALIQTDIVALQLFIVEDKNTIVLRAVLNEGSFKNEFDLELINSYIQLRPGWAFEYFFIDDLAKLPKADDLGDGYFLMAINSTADTARKGATITAMKGQLYEGSYELKADTESLYNIGRGKETQLDNGYYHTNDIAFTVPEDEGYDTEKAEPNKYVSRVHSAIYYDIQHRCFSLKVLPGGTFLHHNNTRIIRKINGEPTIINADNTMLDHPLQHKDQILLGKVAVLEFTLEK